MLDPRKSPTDTSISNSSFSSLAKHSSGVSPDSILPPGNSHLPVKMVFGVSLINYDPAIFLEDCSCHFNYFSHVGISGSMKGMCFSILPPGSKEYKIPLNIFRLPKLRIYFFPLSAHLFDLFLLACPGGYFFLCSL